jgi:hypothetical protein
MEYSKHIESKYDSYDHFRQGSKEQGQMKTNIPICQEF